MAVLIACLDALFDEFNEVAPDRDKSTDGWIGDTSHQASTSDHNPDETGNVPIHDADSKDEVHAIDVDKDLHEDFTMEDAVQLILGRCRSGKEKRLRYIIYNRRIWEADEGWDEDSYSGSNPHDKHAHFSASYETKYEDDRSSWGLEELVALSSADKDWIENTIARYVGDVVQRYDDNGNAIDGTDNDTMWVSSGVGYACNYANLANKKLDDVLTLLENSGPV